MNLAITIAGHAVVTCAWSDFARDNADAFTRAELAAMRLRLVNGDRVEAGGGASPSFTIEKIEA